MSPLVVNKILGRRPVLRLKLNKNKELNLPMKLGTSHVPASNLA